MTVHKGDRKRCETATCSTQVFHSASSGGTQWLFQKPDRRHEPECRHVSRTCNDNNSERNHLGDVGPGSSVSPLSPPLSFLLSLSLPLSFLLSLLSCLLSSLPSSLLSPLFSLLSLLSSPLSPNLSLLSSIS